jgi:hypothetical protein
MPTGGFTPKLIFDVDLRMPDLTGDGEFGIMVVSFLIVSGVKLTCLVVAEAVFPPGVTGRDFSRLGLLGLLDNEGIEVGLFIVELEYLSIDLARSSLLGLWRNCLG